MRRVFAMLLLLTLVVSGCGAGAKQPEPPPEPPPVAKAPQPPDQPAPPAPPGPEKAPPPIDPNGFVDEALSRRIGEMIQAKGVRVEGDGPRLFALQLAKVPSGYTRLVAAVADMKLFLVAVADDGSAQLLVQVDEAAINMAKLWVTSTADKVEVLSQAPFRASEFRVEIGWDGARMTKLSEKTADPTYDYFGSKQGLIDKKDIDGLMALGAVKDVLYPGSVWFYWTQPAQILLLAYEKSLERYRAGDLPLALRTLQYGADQYTQVYNDLLEPTDRAQPKENLLTVAERVPIANDLAFFLAESGKHQEALSLLQKVIEVAPDRAVAYLNLADVEWELGQKAGAKVHYQKYLDLLGPDKAKAPERVLQRLNQ